MFERRLKIFLSIVLALAVVLLVRAGQLQLVQADQYKEKANRALTQSTLIEAQRGPITDVKGKLLASDSPSIDAAVDYRAIIKDADWLKDYARARLRNRSDLTGDRQNRKALVDEEISQVSADIDGMWLTLARVGKKTPDEIEEIKSNITRQVQLRRRFVWYKRYASALQKHDKQEEEHAKEPPSWLKRLLLGDSTDMPQVDDFKITVEEEKQSHVLLRDIDPDQTVELSKRLERSPGLVLRKSTHRHYAEPANLACAHLLGRLSPVTRETLEHDPFFGKDELRQLGYNDQAGVTGLEKLFELKLRGTKGKVEKYLGKSDANQTLAPDTGQEVRCSIDLDLQVQIMSAFQRVEVHNPTEVREGLHGAAVVIDVPTGEVRALVSYPTFDLNKLDLQYNDLAHDMINQPLLNRATMDQFEPGSTAKTMVGTTAITKGFVGLHEGIECLGYLVLPDLKTGKLHRYGIGRCWVARQFERDLGALGVMHHPIPPGFPHHGSFGNPDGYLTVTDAIERSCNVVFETIADRMGLSEIAAAFRNFGLGSRTGLGIEERSGRLPDPARVSASMARYTTWFAGIGQGEVWATPVQMANVAATLARNGNWVRPHLLAGEELGPKDRRNLGLSPESLAAVKDGMIRVVNSDAGTGMQARLAELSVAAKTGSAQTGKFKLPLRDAQGKEVYDHGVRQYAVYEPGAFPWYQGVGEHNDALAHAWYIGYAPAENPKIAFAVLVEYGGSGGRTAGPIAKLLLEACMEHGYLAPTRGGAVKSVAGSN